MTVENAISQAIADTRYLKLAGGTMTGNIAMGSNAISGTGAISGAAITGTSFVIGANALTTAEWAFLDGQDQAVAQASSPTFAGLTLNGNVKLLGGQVVDQVTKVANYTATAGDYVILCDTDTAGAVFTITLPAAASHTGRVYYVKNTGTTGYDVTLDGNGAETIDGDATQAISDGECLVAVCDGTEWWII